MTVAERVISTAKVLKHNYVKVGQGAMFGQASDFYACQKCRTAVHIPRGHEVPLMMKMGCTRIK